MQELFSLGELYISDFLKPEESPCAPPVEMKLMLDDNGAVKLEKTAAKDTMWGDRYWYRSSINSTMRGQLKDVVDSILKVYHTATGDVWIDIASNDGFLLSCVPPNMVRIGVDPANDSFRLECERHADLVIQDYFSVDIFRTSKFGHRKAKVITTISMFYDLVEPDKFIRDVYDTLDDDGLWVVQMSYTPLMLQQMEFPNICHEHAYYYSLFNIKKLFEANGFKLMDCELNNTNSGSFRVYAMKDVGDTRLFSSLTGRDVCAFRLNSILEYERTLKLDSADTWFEFYNKINELKTEAVEFIKSVKSMGQSVMAYGASTKGSTLLQYYDLNHTMIDAVAERSPYKYGLRMIGVDIPIISEDEMRSRRPDYLLILPVHFLSEFMERERSYLEDGGKFIVPYPKFKIITK